MYRFYSWIKWYFAFGWQISVFHDFTAIIYPNDSFLDEDLYFICIIETEFVLKYTTGFVHVPIYRIYKKVFAFSGEFYFFYCIIGRTDFEGFYQFIWFKIDDHDFTLWISTVYKFASPELMYITSVYLSGLHIITLTYPK